MKIHSGFVSNSSSSSFILVVSKANHERVMARLKPHFAWVIERAVSRYRPVDHDGGFRTNRFKEAVSLYECCDDYDGTSDSWSDLDKEWRALVTSSPIEALERDVSGEPFPFPSEPIPESVLRDGVEGIINWYKEMAAEQPKEVYEYSEHS